MNVLFYIRVSGRGQIEGDGPDRQRDAMSNFVRIFPTLISVGEFFEGGVSGTIEAMDRPEFAEMVEYVERHKDNPEMKVGAIVVERMDRLARDLMVQEFLLAECRKRGIKVFSADQGALIDMASDGGDPTRKLIRQILGALAEWEKTMLVMKLRKARERIRSKTGRCEGQKPYGSTSNEKTILDFVRHNLDQNWSHQRTADLLNSAGFTDRKGKAFTRHSAKWVIRAAKQKGNEKP